jgi:hypothetical protein
MLLFARCNMPTNIQCHISYDPTGFLNLAQRVDLRSLDISEPMLDGSPCHHGMARPRVADGRDGLQLEVSCEYIE